MIGQTVIGKSFGGCVRYVMEKDGAEILEASGVRSDNPRSAEQDFNMIRKQNQRVINAVWHTSISFAYEDKVNAEMMKEIAKDYISKVGLDNSQYLIVKHNDTKHEHMHIVANRVQYNGQTVSDQYCKNRTAKACDELEVKHSLTIARGHSSEHINDKIPNKKEIKLQLGNILKEGIEKGCSSWDELKDHLGKSNVQLNIQTQSTGRVNGVSFSKDDWAIKGSAIDKKYSFSKLEKLLNQNISKGHEIR